MTRLIQNSVRDFFLNYSPMGHLTQAYSICSRCGADMWFVYLNCMPRSLLRSTSCPSEDGCSIEQYLLELLASLKMWPSLWRDQVFQRPVHSRLVVNGQRTGRSGWNFWRDERRVRIIIRVRSFIVALASACVNNMTKPFCALLPLRLI